METKGYTLVELVVTLGVVGILTVTALPSLREVVVRERLVTRSNALIGLLNAARVRAVVTGTQTVACPSDDGVACRGDGAWSRGHLAFDDVDGDRTLDAGETIFRSETRAEASVAMRSSRPFVVFRASGRADGTNLTIRLCHGPSTTPAQPGEAGRTIHVNNAGRTRQSRMRDCPPVR